MVKNGIDCIDRYDEWFHGRRLGLITSISGVDCRLNSSVDVLHKRYGLTALFAPEHGVRGDKRAGALFGDETDPATGIPVYSVYNKDSKSIGKDKMDLIDTLIYDIQDVGVRYYTFISTMIYAMSSCETCNRELVILDRLNPLGGAVEGGGLSAEFKSFIGAYDLPVRYGMTIGEMAEMIYHEQKFHFPLHVVPIEGWRRSMMFSECGNFWVMPSPGMPTYETALLYPGMCLFEGTNLSEGRGSAAPFRMIGAPFLKAGEVCDEMNRKDLPGIRFSPAYFTPSFSKFEGEECEGEECEGVYAHISDSAKVLPVRVGYELMFQLQAMYPRQFSFLPPQKDGSRRFIELLTGYPAEQLNGDEAAEIYSQMAEQRQEFLDRSAPYYLYQ